MTAKRATRLRQSQAAPRWERIEFTNGHIMKGSAVMNYYGVSDTVICAAQTSIQEILNES